MKKFSVIAEEDTRQDQDFNIHELQDSQLLL